EALYDSVGIRTIVLDPNGKATTKEQRERLFGEFMLELSRNVATEGRMPGQPKKMFMSLGMIERFRNQMSRHRSPVFDDILHDLVQRQVPPQLSRECATALLELGRFGPHGTYSVSRALLALSFVKSFGVTPGASLCFWKSMINSVARKAIFEQGN